VNFSKQGVILLVCLIIIRSRSKKASAMSSYVPRSQLYCSAWNSSASFGVLRNIDFTSCKSHRVPFSSWPKYSRREFNFNLNLILLQTKQTATITARLTTHFHRKAFIRAHRSFCLATSARILRSLSSSKACSLFKTFLPL
jgi:hypothetical protein